MEGSFKVFLIKDRKFETDECKTLMVYPANPEQTSELEIGLRRMLRDIDQEWRVIIGYNHIGTPILCSHEDFHRVASLRWKFQRLDNGGWYLYIPDKYLGPEPFKIEVSTAFEGLDQYNWNNLNNYIHYDSRTQMKFEEVTVDPTLNTDIQYYTIKKPTGAIEKLTQEVRKGLEKFKYEYAGGNHMDEQKLNEFSPTYLRAFSFSTMSNIANNIENSLKSMERTNKKCGTNFDVGSLLIRSIFINEKKHVVTIIWSDNEVTMGRCGPNDDWDPEKGIAIAFMKRFWASTTQFNKFIKEVIPASEDAKDSVKEETK